MKTFKRLSDAYRFPGFTPRITLKGLYGDHRARIVTLRRRGKKQSAEPVAVFLAPFTTAKRNWSETSLVATCASTWRLNYDVWIAKAVAL